MNEKTGHNSSVVVQDQTLKSPESAQIDNILKMKYEKLNNLILFKYEYNSNRNHMKTGQIYFRTNFLVKEDRFEDSLNTIEWVMKHN